MEAKTGAQNTQNTPAHFPYCCCCCCGCCCCSCCSCRVIPTRPWVRVSGSSLTTSVPRVAYAVCRSCRSAPHASTGAVLLYHLAKVLPKWLIGHASLNTTLYATPLGCALFHGVGHPPTHKWKTSPIVLFERYMTDTHIYLGNVKQATVTRLKRK